MKTEKINRKEFLKKAAMGLVSIPLIIQGCSTEAESQMTNHCGLTDSATEGPFFVSNTPESVNINFTNLPGKPMKVKGTVYGGKDGETPLANAKIEVWHCDGEGVYYPEGSGDISRYKNSDIALRGHVFTNQKGEYAFHSIQPGLYTGRRRHIHYKITAKNHQELTTQSYWLSEKGDERERYDRTDRNTEACRYIDFKGDGKNGIEGTFDIYLKQIG
jgi:protocatechuate 3,4-dioxygenase beta subunit